MARPDPNSGGRSLKQLVERNGPLPISRAAMYVEQAARLLGVYHERGMLHANVRPGNVFVDDLDQVILGPSPEPETLDDLAFGEKNERQLLEMADYLAPELVLNNRVVDFQADQYSLGCTFYYLLAGRPPFSNGSIAERLLQHHVTRPTEVEKLRGDVPQAIAKICSRMLEKKPADRFATSMLVAEMIRAWRMEGYD